MWFFKKREPDTNSNNNDSVENNTKSVDEVTGRVFDTVNSQFSENINESFYKNFQESYNKEIQNRYGDTPNITAQTLAGHIQDILTTLSIPYHTSIASDVLMPDDVSKIGFDMLTPMGYDTVQVDNFVSQTKMSVETYLNIIKEKLTHIAKLASVIDRMQVDINNYKFQNELSAVDSNVSVLENEIVSLKLENDGLRKKLALYENKNGEIETMTGLVEELKGEVARLNVVLAEETERNNRLEQKLVSNNVVQDGFMNKTGLPDLDGQNHDSMFTLPDVEEDHIEPMFFGGMK